jgi:ubiquitin thioesterase OTU1
MSENSEAALNLRARTKKGIIKITSLTSKSTIHELKKAISELTGLDLNLIKLLKGYPPKQFDQNNEHTTLNFNQIKNGELLTVEESQSSSESLVQTTKITPKTNSFDFNAKLDGVLLRKVVPANNSCLFTSVNFVMMENGVLDLDCQKSMRELIACTVKSDPIFYSEGILGKKNKDYCDWIRNPTSWGGCIECMILSKYYKCEICVVDIRTGRIDKFGEDCNYDKRYIYIF